MSQIRAQTQISQYVTLLDQRGSKVTFGNVLSIPIESSLLYAVPLYVQASSTTTPTPEISQVILANGDRIVMRPTLNEAVAALGGRAAPSGRPTAGRPGTPPGVTATTPELIRRASEAYRRARELQREYNRSLDDLGEALDSLDRGANPR